VNDKADFTTIVSPRTYGLSTYTDEQLSATAKNYLRTNLVQGLRDAPSHIMRVEVTPKGVLAHCRYWREGDTVVNPKGSIQGKVLRDSNGQLFADFDGARSPLGGSLYPLLHGDNMAPRHTPSIKETGRQPDWEKLYQSEVEDLRADYIETHFRAMSAEAALKQTQDDGRLILNFALVCGWAHLRLSAAGLTDDESERIRALRNSLDDDGERPAVAELAAVRHLLALGDFFDYPAGPLPVGFLRNATAKANLAQAEARAAQAEARAAQAEADSKLLLGELYSADLADEGGFFAWGGLLTNEGMTEAEMDAVRKLPTAGGDTRKLLAAVRRVVGKQ